MSSDSRPSRRRRSRSFGSKQNRGGDGRSRKLEGTFGPDRAKLRRLLRKRAPDVADLIAASNARVAERLASTPKVSYPEELPFSERVGDIRELVAQSQVVVVCGETGSGKSTQIPKLCLELGLGASGLIAHTQPRRLAARSVAERVAHELGVKLGDEVGSKVRFSDQTSDRTLVKVMTDGMLLAESRSDRLLEQYSAIIVDEAHERSLNIDFLLGIISRILPRRPELKLIVTSATIDPERFATHYAAVTGKEVPIVEVSGRTYPVDIEYHPPIDEAGHVVDLPDAIADAAERLAIKDGFNPAGDVLVFLPGEREIREAARALRRRCEITRLLHGTEIVPLYARLSFAEQQRVFRRAPHRRIVLATNVAETSLTVPGIRYVIDSGLARISRYSPRRRVQSLQIEAISQASARQRAGRCGRTEPGTCLRLFAEDDHDKRDEFTPPEIQRTNLAGVILQMQSLGLGEPEEFPFLEPPESRRISEAYETLFELGAVDDRRVITPIGREMARLPIDPRLARILIAARDEGVLADALVITSALEVQDPRERPAEARDAADAKHQRFNDAASDFVTLLNLWDHYHSEKDRLSRSQLRKQCIAEFINAVRMNEWTDTHRQLRDQCRELGWRVARRKKELDRDALHRAVLAGCLTTVGKSHDEGGFVSPFAGIFHVHPGSSVKAKGSTWLVTAELVRTTRLYARLSARIEGAWVEELAPHLIRREYSDAEFIAERGRVEARAKVTFGQIEISRGRMVDYGSVDRPDARRVFIEEALVHGRLETGAPYERHNAALLEDLHEREARLRRPVAPSDEQLMCFFDERLPEDISTTRGFDRWRRRAEHEDPRVLFMSPEAIGCADTAPIDKREHPDTIVLGEQGAAELVYRLDPGTDSDGIQARLGVVDASRATPVTFDWLVPAWLPEKVEAVLRGLPRAIRRQYDPAELTARVLASLNHGEGDLFARIADEAARATGLTITPKMCREVELPSHLRMSGVLLDENEREIAKGDDFSELIATARRLESENRRDASKAPIHRVWPRHEDPIQPPVGLVDAVSGVRLIEHGDDVTADTLHWFGCRRLVGVELSKEVGRLLKHTPHAQRLAVHMQTLDGAASLADEIAALLPEVNRLPNAQPFRSLDEFERGLELCRESLGDRVSRVTSLMAQIMDARQAALSAIDSPRSAAADLAKRDMEFQLRQLVHTSTFRRARWNTLTRLPAYVKGIPVRAERLRGDGIAKDRAAMAGISPHWKRCLEHAQQLARIGRESPALDRYRWMIEEQRLNLFAPVLAARKAASEKLLERAWEEIERGG